MDVLAGFVGLRGARGVVVFDGVGAEERRGPLTVRFATPADSLLERLAADHRVAERVCLVSSDLAVRQTAGQEVRKRASKEFVAELLSEAERQRPHREPPSRIEDALDEPTRERLERLVSALEPVAERLGCADELVASRTLLAGNGADRQRSVAEREGLDGVVRWLVAETEGSALAEPYER